MSGISFWTQGISDAVTIAPTCTKMPFPAALRLLPQFDAPQNGTVYVGEVHQVVSLLRQGPSCRGTIFFAAGINPSLPELAQQAGAGLVMAPTTLMALYEHVSLLLERYHRWQIALLTALSKSRRATKLLDTASALLDARFVLLDSHNQPLTSPALDPVLTQMLPGDFARLLQTVGPDGVAHLKREGLEFFVKLLVAPLPEQARLLLFPSARCNTADVGVFLHLLDEMLQQCVFPQHWQAEKKGFVALLPDILEQRLKSEDEINRGLAALDPVPDRFCNFVVVEFSDQLDSIRSGDQLVADLEDVFPDCHTAFYQDMVVILLSRPDRQYQPKPIFDEPRLTEILKKHDAYAGISNATSRRVMLRSNFLLSRATLHLGKALRENPQDRFFFFEDYATYLMIDLCINSFSDLLGHDDIIYLTHPEAIHIYRYDKSTNSDLLKILYYYCLSNGSIGQAAKSAYMHRNTFASRLSKLQGMVKSNLMDSATQQRMIFSYKIIRYYDCYTQTSLEKRLRDSASLRHEAPDPMGL